MNIGLVLSKTPSYSETFFMSKIKGLQLQGHSVTLFVQSNDHNFELCKVRTAAPIFRKNVLGQLWWFFKVFIKLMGSLNASKKFLQLERRNGIKGFTLIKKIYFNAHILTENLDWLHFGFATMALGKENVAKSVGAKMAVSFRGFDMAIYPIKHPNCYDLLWKRLDKVHSISDDLYELALKYGLSKSTSYQKITPAIDINLFEVQKKSSEMRFDGLNMITVGRLHWKKGFTYTLMALKELKENGVDFKYTIVGEGAAYEKLMYLRYQLGLENEVIILGKVSHYEVRELLSKHEVYIQYSISEGFCNAVLEAQAMGLLCVVSDAEGLAENVLHEKSGWVVPKRNPKKLAEKILQVSKMLDVEKREIQDFAIHRIRNEFNLEKQQQEFLKFYND